MKTLYRLPLLFAVILPLTLSGQKAWTLQECIKYAWENNIQLKQQEIVSEQSKNNVEQAKYSFLPTLNGSLSHSMNWGRSVNMQDLQIIQNKLYQSTGASVRASVDIFNGFQKSYDAQSKKIQYEITLQDASLLKNNISIEISRAYLQILLSKEVLKVSQESFNSISEQVVRTKKFVDAGSQAMGTLLEMEAQMATERVQVVNAQNQVRANILTLKQLLDLPEEISFDVLIPDIDVTLAMFKGEDINNLYSISMNLPQIQSAKLALQNSGTNLKLAKGQLLPSVSLSAGYGTNYSDSRSDAFFQQMKDNRNPSVSFSLSIPIFNSLSAKTMVKNAELSLKNSQLNLKSKEQQLFKEIQQANNDALALYEKYIASGQNVKAMEESFRYVQTALIITSKRCGPENLYG
jgi:outer membrane protein